MEQRKYERYQIYGMNNPMMTLVYLNIAGAKESRGNKSRNSRA